MESPTKDIVFGPTTPLDLILSELEMSKSRSPDLKALYLVMEPSYALCYY